MKLIRTVLHPSGVNAVKEALAEVGVPILMRFEIREHDPTHPQMSLWRGDVYDAGLSRMELEMTVNDEDVDDVIDIIINTARESVGGDGHISVLPLEHRYDLKTGARTV